MKKTLLLLIATLSAITIVHAQRDWITYKIDNKLSVKLPVQPVTANKNTVAAQSKDSLIFIVSVIDFTKVSKLDSVTLAGLVPTADFANGMRKSMIGKMPGYTLGDITIGKWKDYYCYHLEGSNTAMKLKISMLMVIIGQNMYSLSALVPDNAAAGGKDDFLNSLTLN